MRKYSIVFIILGVIGVGGYFSYQAYLQSKIRTTPIVDPDVAHATAYSLAEVSAHAVASDCWTIVDSKVYNLTSFIPSHPGGDAILPACGSDGTELFNSVKQHERENANETLVLYQIGILMQ